MTESKIVRKLMKHDFDKKNLVSEKREKFSFFSKGLKEFSH